MFVELLARALEPGLALVRREADEHLSVLACAPSAAQHVLVGSSSSVQASSSFGRFPSSGSAGR